MTACHTCNACGGSGTRRAPHDQGAGDLFPLRRDGLGVVAMIRVKDTPWVRDAMTADEDAQLHALRNEATDGFLSLLADGPRGPYIGRLNIPGREEIRTSSLTLAELFRALIREVLA